MSSYLKIMTCGNVDDGKSTLLGRLFFETGNITKDQSSYLDSKKLKKSDIDYSLLLDGLIDEKSQGITIDIAFKYFRLGNKPCIFIDSPGHTEYTRNMANAATFSNVALVIFDITKPLSDQTKNHLKIVKTFPNIKKLILIYNKLDKLGFNEKKYKNNNVKNLKTNISNSKIKQSVNGNTNTVYINPMNSLLFVLKKLQKDKIKHDKDFYVFTGSSVGVVPILGKGTYKGKIDKLGSVKAKIN